MQKRFIAVALIVVIMVSLTFTGCKPDENDISSIIDMVEDIESLESSKEEQSASDDSTEVIINSEEERTEGVVDSVLSYLPLTADDDGLLDKNPDRGFRTEMVLRIDATRVSGKKHDKRTVFADESESTTRAVMEGVFDSYFNTAVQNDKMFLAYIYLTDYHDTDISAGALRAVEIFFEICRERKVKSMLRICYNWSYAKNFKLSDENKRLLASECADQSTILRHIKQLKPLISEYADTIHTISNGFIGYVGEWAYSYQYPSVDYPTVMRAIVEELCVPNGLYFSNRDPEYKNQLLAAYPNYKYKNYIGNNNDAMFGEQTNKDWYSGNMQLGRPEWQQVTNEAAYTPQDGEMFTLNALIDTDNGRYYNPRIPSGMQMILECAHHRHTSMSNWHCYAEALSPSHKNYANNIMLNWKTKSTITASELSNNKIIFDPNWFVDDSGNTVTRNPYDFLRDHLGYRLVATGGHVTSDYEAGSTLSFELKLKNYGFAAAFMLESGFALLDENYNVISTVKAGEPDKWYSHDPKNYLSTTVLEHSVSADFTLPSKAGDYYIGFYLKNTMNDYARLSIKNSFKNGHTILYGFNIR